MKTTQIPKKSGGFRTVLIQSPRETHALRALAHRLNEIILADPVGAAVIHGFLPGRNPVTNALAHSGPDCRFTLSCDLRDFFDHCTQSRLIMAGVPRAMIAQVVFPSTQIDPPPPEPYAAQGLSSSPSAANLAALPLDRTLHRYCQEHGIVYTRYADDLTFSGPCKSTLLTLRDALPVICKTHGQELHTRKTRLQDARFGRRIITGVAIDEHGQAHPTRAVKRRLRTLHHAARTGKPWAPRIARGLEEWSLCKTPTGASIPKTTAAWIHDQTKAALNP